MTASTNKRTKAYVTYIAAMAIFGSNGLLVTAIPMTSVQIVMFRTLMGSFFLGAIYLFSADKSDRGTVARALPVLIPAGLCLGGNWIFLFEAFKYASVSVGILVYYTAPVLVMAASVVLFREKLSLQKALGIAAVIAGMLLVNGFSGRSADVQKGVLCGMVSAVLYAALVVLNKMVRGVSSVELTLFELVIAAVLLTPYALITQGLSFGRPNLWQILALLTLGVVNTGIACWMYFSSMRELPAQSVALFSYVDPLSALILSALVLGDRLTVLQACGAALILGGALFGELAIRRRKHAKERS